MSLVQSPLGNVADGRKVSLVENLSMLIGFGVFLSIVPLGITFFNNVAIDWFSDPPKRISLPAWPFWIACTFPLIFIVFAWRVLDSRFRYFLMVVAIYTTVFYVAFPCMYARAYPAENGILYNGVRLGWHWIGAAMGAFALILVLVRLATVPKSAFRNEVHTPKGKWHGGLGRKETKANLVEINRIALLVKTPEGMKQYLEELKLEAERRRASEGAAKVEEAPEVQ